MPYKDKEQEREKVRRHRRNNRPKYAAKQKAYYIKNPEIYLLSVCRARAKKQGIPFNLTKEDFVAPAVCPVFGTPFERGVKSFCENAPSIDKIIPELGYVKGNTAIISWRANRIKCNATAADIRKVADWLDAELEVRKSDPQSNIPQDSQ